MAAQLPDSIFLRGKKMDLYSNPLETYWEDNSRKKPQFFELDVCKRGYVASWAIENNELLLVDIEGDVSKNNFFIGKKWVKANLATLFPKAKNRKVLASWFSGKLRIPDGNMTNYAPHDYHSRFEREIIVTVEKGTVVKMVVLDYSNQRLIVDPVMRPN